MLRQVFILQHENIIYQQDFGTALSGENLGVVMNTVKTEIE